MYLNILREDNAHVIQFTEGDLAASVFTELKAKVMDAVSENKSVVISFEKAENVDDRIFAYLPSLHDELYQQYHLSFVICGMNPKWMGKDMSELNITPTLIEALDIVNMEVIERELLG